MADNKALKAKVDQLSNVAETHSKSSGSQRQDLLRQLAEAQESRDAVAVRTLCCCCCCVPLAQLLCAVSCLTAQEECLNLQRDLVQARSALVRSNSESQSRLADAESRVKAVEADAEVSASL
jgi:hypothetical protein